MKLIDLNLWNHADGTAHVAASVRTLCGQIVRQAGPWSSAGKLKNPLQVTCKSCRRRLVREYLTEHPDTT